MVALTVDSPEKVDEVHAKAMELGGQDECAPGRRSEGFYAGYFRDLDGNKLNVFCAGPAAG
jgi:predicted lactoylglutathione lyase